MNLIKNFNFNKNYNKKFFFYNMNINYNMTNKNKNRQLKEATRFACDMLKESKIIIIILSVISLITLLTGIIVAIKTRNSFSSLNGYGVVDVRTGGLTTSFFTRLFSMLFIALILFGCSFSIYIFPIGVIFLSYRAYLLGLNVCLLIIKYGFSGVVISVIVAFPCQLLALMVLGVFFILMTKTIKDYKCFGGCRVPKQRAKLIVSTAICLSLICIFESVFLVLFSAKFILII